MEGNQFTEECIERMKKLTKESVFQEKGCVLTLEDYKDEEFPDRWKIHCIEESVVEGGFSETHFNPVIEYGLKFAGMFHTHPTRPLHMLNELQKRRDSAMLSFFDWYDGTSAVQCVGGKDNKGNHRIRCFDFGMEFGMEYEDELFMEKIDRLVESFPDGKEAEYFSGYYPDDPTYKEMMSAFDEYKILDISF